MFSERNRRRRRRNNNTTPSPSHPVYRTTIEILEELKAANHGSHYLIVYPNLDTLREIYSSYIKTALDGRNEIIIFLPFFETINSVRRIITGNSRDAAPNIDVRKHEKEQSLIIIDSLKGYFGIPEGIMPFLKQILEYADTSGRSGVSVFGDVGPFFYYRDKHDDLLQHELSIPSEYKDMNLKTFCLYHKRNFDTRLTEDQKGKLIEHHGKNLIIIPPSSSSNISEGTDYN